MDGDNPPCRQNISDSTFKIHQSYVNLEVNSSLRPTKHQKFLLDSESKSASSKQKFFENHITLTNAVNGK